MQDLSIYIHWPFCLSKCPYCDFNSHVRDHIDEDVYEQALLTELEALAQRLDPKSRRLRSLFFGGGTPSLMRPQTVERLIDRSCKLFPVADAVEVTLEGNPTSIEQSKYEAFKHAGVNRVSIGIQSLHAKQLTFLGRNHSADEALQALSMATHLFDRVNFDLIYALPDQSLESWMQDLEKVVDLGTSHLSLYQLTIEEGTPFYNRYHRGEFEMPSDDLASEFMDLTNRFLEAQGMPAYELSNYARAGHECQHNLTYWRYGDYLGVGPGAHGRLTLKDGQRLSTEMIRAPEAWVRAVKSTGVGVRREEELSRRDQILEHLLMNLRLYEGMSKADFQERHHVPLESVLDQKALESLQAGGFLSMTTDRLSLSRHGMMTMDRVLRDLICDEV